MSDEIDHLSLSRLLKDRVSSRVGVTLFNCILGFSSAETVLKYSWAELCGRYFDSINSNVRRQTLAKIVWFPMLHKFTCFKTMPRVLHSPEIEKLVLCTGCFFVFQCCENIRLSSTLLDSKTRDRTLGDVLDGMEK